MKMSELMDSELYIYEIILFEKEINSDWCLIAWNLFRIDFMVSKWAIYTREFLFFIIYVLEMHSLLKE